VGDEEKPEVAAPDETKHKAEAARPAPPEEDFGLKVWYDPAIDFDQ
jgi:hypothetical protein